MEIATREIRMLTTFYYNDRSKKKRTFKNVHGQYEDTCFKI